MFHMAAQHVAQHYVIDVAVVAATAAAAHHA